MPSILVRCKKCHRPYARVADDCPECHTPSPTGKRVLFAKVGSIVGAVAALAVAISLSRKMPVTKEIQVPQSITSLAPAVEGEISFSH